MLYEDESKCIVVSKTGQVWKHTHTLGHDIQGCTLFSQVPDLKALCVSRSFIEGVKGFEFEFPYKQYKDIILTSDASYFIAYGFDKLKDTLFVYHAETGEFLHKIPVKYPNFKVFATRRKLSFISFKILFFFCLKEVTMIVALPDKPWQVALIDQDKGNMIDVKVQYLAAYFRN